MRLAVLVTDDVFDLGLSAILDAFRTANELADAGLADAEPFDVQTVAVRRTVTTSQGLRVPVQPIGRRAPDCVIVPAIGFKMPGPLEQALARRDVQDATEVLRACAGRGSMIAAACIGTFLLAESGLLDGQRATTTWWLAPVFRRRYPNVALEESKMIVHSDRLVTAGAALGHVDLALWVMRRASPQLASLTAQYLIADARASQAVYALTDHLMHDDPIVRRFEGWTRATLMQGFSLDKAARAVGTSKRTLARRLQTVLGQSPLEYVQHIRVERAVHLLKTTTASVDEIATRVGYADGVTLRTLLRRRLNLGIKQIRRPA